MGPAAAFFDFGKSLRTVAALEQINLDVRENEFVSLLGASGCCKSTLLRVATDTIGHRRRPCLGEVEQAQ